MNISSIWYMLSCLLIHTVSYKASLITVASLGIGENNKFPWCKLFYKLDVINASDYPYSPIMTSNRFVGSVYKTF